MSAPRHPEWWITARRLRRNGLKENAIAERFGVTRSAVTRALYPERYAKFDIAKKELTRERRLKRLRAQLGPWMKKHGVVLSDAALLEIIKAVRGVPRRRNAAERAA